MEEGCRLRQEAWNGSSAPGVACWRTGGALKIWLQPIFFSFSPPRNPEGWDQASPETREQGRPALRRVFRNAVDGLAVAFDCQGLFLVHEESYGIGSGTTIRGKSPAELKPAMKSDFSQDGHT